MMKWILGVLAALSLLGAGAGAYAQSGTVPERPWALRVGALWPTNNAVRDNTHHVWFNAGLDRVISRNQEGNDWLASVDFGNASNVQYWALQALYEWHNTGTLTQGRRFSFGFGGGYYIFDPDFSGKQTEFGIPVFGDWDLSDKLFLQAKYHWVVTDTSVSSFTTTLGLHF